MKLIGVVLVGLLLLVGNCLSLEQEVWVEKIKEMPHNPTVHGMWTYSSQISFYIEHADGTLSAPMWTTRIEENGDGKPYYFSLTQQLMDGFRIGIQQVREGERARIHIPPQHGLGFEDFSQGDYFVPGGSHLLFDVELENLRMGFASDENAPTELQQQKDEEAEQKKAARKTKKEQAKAKEQAKVDEQQVEAVFMEDSHSNIAENPIMGEEKRVGCRSDTM